MVDLVSPEYNLDMFCRRMLGKDLLAVIEATSAEIGNARRLHREATKGKDFQKGSKGWEYCTNLQRLLSMLMNGSVPKDSSQEFLYSIRPLILHLLKKWEIGNLRSVFSNISDPELEKLSEIVDPLIVVISKAEVAAGDTSRALGILKKLKESPKIAKKFFERVEMAFHGYDNHPWELFEIDEVREYVCTLDNEFPFWLYFLSKRHNGLQALFLCFLPPFLTEEGKIKYFPAKINELLTRRWFPALNQMTEYVGMSIKDNESITERTMRYITNGPFRIKGII